MSEQDDQESREYSHLIPVEDSTPGFGTNPLEHLSDQRLLSVLAIFQRLCHKNLDLVLQGTELTPQARRMALKQWSLLVSEEQRKLRMSANRR